MVLTQLCLDRDLFGNILGIHQRRLEHNPNIYKWPVLGVNRFVRRNFNNDVHILNVFIHLRGVLIYAFIKLLSHKKDVTQDQVIEV